MRIYILPDRQRIAEVATELAAETLKKVLAEKGEANLVAATGTSQFEFLDRLAEVPGIDWSKVTFFHLDEYIGLPASHPASFRRYLKERVEQRLKPRAFHYIQGDAGDPSAECRRLAELIRRHPIDMAFLGIGENGHIAFNDPPADFETEEPFLVVDLDEKCRMQQVKEGWFPSLEAVPKQAITMSPRQILRAKRLICLVPDARKAEAVRDCLTHPIDPLVPCTILRRHSDVHLLLDEASAALLPPDRRVAETPPES
ncbi:MAG TPA: glucosamine-6-phosphate deaminase [Acidobacteriota bacterium]|nr:glucosamine-6-phosphate deaminase [Acidobacteriota bacterium]HRR25213.1 glucosamine-6-phosphate deaminase [Acidobacteriota bacterium]HRR57656.1 glucosamine-6-phosphate deaminase [Acidobacteriota bacterium]HRV07514.1 glucosamine-6-phosphate deaminase [Acidobacteriota bacterium]